MSGPTHDTISLPTSDFASFAAVLAAARDVGGNTVIAAPSGDTLTLDNVTTTALAGAAADFSVHG